MRQQREPSIRIAIRRAVHLFGHLFLQTLAQPLFDHALIIQIAMPRKAFDPA